VRLESLDRPEFLLDFYGFFMDSSEEVRRKFANTDIKRQARVLGDSFRAMSVAAQGPRTSAAWATCRGSPPATAVATWTSRPTSTMRGSTA
jgi:hypothetical protein